MVTMRFRKGSKVEVLKKTEVPSGSWWCAEIISGNGHTYHVKYLQSPTVITEERVSRKVIRPLPPPTVGEKDWAPGDIVEVHDNNSWKISEISKVVDGNYFYVRLLGSSTKFCVHKFNLRLRQSWQGNQWFVIGKNVRDFSKVKRCKLPKAMHNQTSNCQLPLSDTTLNTQAGDRQFHTKDGTGFEEKASQMFSSRRSVKRGLQTCLFPFETTADPNRKVRAIEKEGRVQREVRLRRSSLLDKVDAVASPRIRDENYLHSSFNNRATGFSEMDVEESRNCPEDGCFVQRSLESRFCSESRATSVASSSSSSPYPCTLSCLYMPAPRQESYLDDADSSCCDNWAYRRESFSPTNEEVRAETHKSKLYAYRAAMEALFAIGPLTWEQEEMMTNLRLSLDISNDEHLMELRHLVSAQS